MKERDGQVGGREKDREIENIIVRTPVCPYVSPELLEPPKPLLNNNEGS